MNIERIDSIAEPTFQSLQMSFKQRKEARKQEQVMLADGWKEKWIVIGSHVGFKSIEVGCFSNKKQAEELAFSQIGPVVGNSAAQKEWHRVMRSQFPKHVLNDATFSIKKVLERSKCCQ